MKLNFSQLLALVFIYLQLTNQIDWSWWWVTCPLWISIIYIVINGMIKKQEPKE